MQLDIRDNVLLHCTLDKDDSGEVIIPEGVSAIGEAAFTECKNLKRVVMPNSLVLIGCEAFHECSSLSEVIMPDSVVDIGAEAFSGCPIRKIRLSENLAVIDKFAFQQSCLEELTLPKSLKTIGRGAFSSNPLTEVEIPESIETLGEMAFYKCEKLSRVILPKGLKAIDAQAFTSCYSLHSIDLPPALEQIGSLAFHESGLKTLTLPASLKKIESFAFGRTNLKQLILPEGLEEIDCIAFYHMDLKTITLPASLKKVYGNSISPQTEVLVDENNPHFVKRGGFILTRDGKTLVRGANTPEVIIPEGVEVIGDGAFEEFDKVERIALPESVTEIRRWAFLSCRNLKQVNVPPRVKSIGEHAFLNCTGLNHITLPYGLEELSDAFSNCVMDCLTVPPHARITKDSFFSHGTEKITKLVVNTAVTDYPKTIVFMKKDETEITEKIIRGYAAGANAGYPFSDDVAAKNNEWIGNLGAGELLAFSEEFIYFAVKHKLLSHDTAENLIELNRELSLSLRSALVEYAAETADPLDKFKL